MDFILKIILHYNFKKFLRKDGIAVSIIVDVAKSKTCTIPLGREFCRMIKENETFKLIYCVSESIANFEKTTRMWGDSKGKATATDKIVILSDINPFKKFKKISNLEQLDFAFIEESTKLIIG